MSFVGRTIMPLSKHYGGHGQNVMRDMHKRYGPDAKRIFYATENQRKKDMIAQLTRKRRHG